QRRRVMRTGHAEALPGLTQEVLLEAGLTLDDIARFATSIGPGSFTGLRVGLSFCRGLALAKSVPAVGVTTLAAIAHAAAIDRPDGALTVAVFDARRNEGYWQVFDGLEAPITPPALAPIDGIVAALHTLPRGSAVHLVGTGAPLLAPALADAKSGSPGAVSLSEAAPLPDAAAVGALAARIEDPQTAPARPLYLRSPDATPAKPVFAR
ncbi:MAG: tRNA (adenosine(37)-N6)-threonylcarbamoyltransferase complex dimerization subunit type 1 TsaB, partial [Pseudomonadota bacterium]